MATTKKTPKQPVKKPPKAGGSAPGSNGLGPYFGGVKNNPALFGR